MLFYLIQQIYCLYIQDYVCFGQTHTQNQKPAQQY